MANEQDSPVGVSPGEVTRLLIRAGEGHKSAVEELLPLVYEALRGLAASYYRKSGPENTLQPTALVHEAYLRLVGASDIAWTGRAHFFAVAANAMRRILISHAEKKRTAKRGGEWHRIPLTSDLLPKDSAQEVDLLDLEDALVRLEELDPRQARIVELRFFAGLSVEEAAHVLEVSPRTVELDWRMARSWLLNELAR